MIKVEYLPIYMVDTVWPLVARGIEDACRKTGGDLTNHYLWSECRAGRAFLAVVKEDDNILGASVWRFEDWTEMGRVIRCLALYGSRFMEWKDEHRRVTRELAMVGRAVSFITEGRAGFERLYPGARVIRQLYEDKV